MLLQPFANAGHRALVCVRRRVRTVEYPHFAKQDDGNATTLPLTERRTKLCEQRFDIAPLNVCARWVSKDQSKCSLVLLLHLQMVPLFSTAPPKHLAPPRLDGELHGARQFADALIRGQRAHIGIEPLFPAGDREVHPVEPADGEQRRFGQ